MRYIVWSIQNSGKLPLPTMEELYKEAPYLERTGKGPAEGLPSPRHLSVHTPYSHTPIDPMARYIYVARNPRDTCVSYYHFTKEGIGGSKYQDATFDEYFQSFVEGNVPYGDYFDHVKEWWDHRHDANVLFLTYEDMMANPKEAVLKVASFISTKTINYEKIVTNNQDEILNKVVKNTTFNMMKNTKVVIKAASSSSCGDSLLDSGVKVNFFRKGIVGDWINYFSPQQLNQLNRKMMEKVAGSGIEDLWTL